MKVILKDFKENELLDDLNGKTMPDSAEMAEETRVMGSSPPYSPPLVLPRR